MCSIFRIFCMDVAYVIFIYRLIKKSFMVKFKINGVGKCIIYKGKKGVNNYE